MKTTITIIGLVLVVCYFAYTWYETFKLQLRLQELAETFPIDFRLFVEKEEGWEVYDRDSHNGKGCIKLIPNPRVSWRLYYYIKFTGPIDEEQAIRFLIRGFLKYMHDRGRI